MTDQLTIKQKMFAQIYVETGNASEAYRTAYDVKDDTKPETVWTSASVLLTDPKVSQRVMELQEEMRERHAVTVDKLTRELDEDRTMARAEKMPSAAITAVMSKAKLHGLVADKKVLSGPDDKPIQVEDVTTITPQRRRAMLEMMRREIDAELDTIDED